MIGTIINDHLANNRAAISFISVEDFRIHVVGYDLDKITLACPYCEATGRVPIPIVTGSAEVTEEATGFIGLSCPGAVGPSGPIGWGDPVS